MWIRNAYAIVWLAGSEIKLARIDRDGHVTTPRTLLSNVFVYGRQFAATNGSRLAIAYAGAHGGYLRIAVFTSEGDAIATDVFLPVRPGSGNFGSSIASNGSDFLVSWLSSNLPNGELDAARLRDDGTFIDTAARFVSDALLSDAGIASDGDAYLLLYYDRSQGISARRVPRDFNGMGPAIRVTNSTPYFPSVIWTGTNYLAVVMDFGIRKMTAIPLDREGHPTTSRQMNDFGSLRVQQFPALATNGNVVAFAWSEARFGSDVNSNYDIFGIVADIATLTPAAEQLLTFSSPEQRSPAIAFSGENYLTVWTEDGGLYFGRVARDGVRLDGRGVMLSSSQYGAAKVVFDGVNYLVAWGDSGNGQSSFKAVAISTSGRIQPGGLNLSTPVCGSFGHDLIVGPPGETLLVTSACAVIEGRRLDHFANPIDSAPLLVAPSGAAAGAPAGAWNGHEYLVAWQEHVPIPQIPEPFIYNGNIRAARVTPTLGLLGAMIEVGVGQESDAAPVVASDGDDFLIAYGHWSSGAHGVRAKHVKGEGAVLDDLLFDDAQATSVVWDGDRYELVTQTPGIPSRIVMTGIGRSAGSSRFDPVIIASGDDVRDPAVMAAGARRVAIAYSRAASEQPYGGALRIFLRVVDFDSRIRAVRHR